MQSLSRRQILTGVSALPLTTLLSPVAGHAAAPAVGRQSPGW